MRKHLLVATGLLVVAGLATTAYAQALGPVHRLSSEFQFAPGGPLEVSTTAVPGVGGTLGTTVYSKTLFTPFSTLFVTFSATGDTHSGAALLMTCVVDGAPCQGGGGLPTAGPSGSITLQKLPQPVAVTNCNDGGGGSADCHDNNINYTWCAALESNGVHTVELKLASSNGSTVFYERAHIIIDATPNARADARCTAAAPAPPVGTLP